MPRKLIVPRFSRQAKHEAQKSNNYIIAAAIVFAAVLLIAVFYPAMQPTGKAILPIKGAYTSTVNYFDANGKFIDVASTTSTTAMLPSVGGIPAKTNIITAGVTKKTFFTPRAIIFSAKITLSTDELQVSTAKNTLVLVIYEGADGIRINYDILRSEESGTVHAFLPEGTENVFVSAGGAGADINLGATGSGQEGLY